MRERERERKNGRPKDDDGEKAMIAEEGRKLYYTRDVYYNIYNFTEKGLCAVEVSRRGQ